ncbi:ABC transporter substrate-binding protein [Gandjariella thermophila]|uniref:Sugar ABC transporter substrate-binding protein n=1 Tax=Gandjariella thermophila TaxID=1931992 RepID=A0A4D4J3H2_9PSEU|nr:ABC transporter substrate-binding protein [Gandjariella thermophila]GDY30004.1 sugar ABC transporter substrate-binding protein [Gandjariella thermophila]
MRGAHPGVVPGRRGRSRRYRAAAALGAAFLAAPMVAACGSGGGGGTTINVYYGPEENFQNVVEACNAKAAGRYRIVYNTLPREADGQREQMVRRLAAGDPGMDVLGLDVTWTPEFAEAGWIEEWAGQNRADVESGTLPGPLKTATYHGKLYAAPKNTNVQLLWYRDDLVPNPPQTWDEMLSMAEQLKQQGKPNEVLVTGAQYEGLVATYNTLVASSGGHIISDDGTRAVMDAGAVHALDELRKLATSPVADPSLSNDKEDSIRHTMEDGRAAFELNWPFVYASMRKDRPELAAHFKWAPYPGTLPGMPGKAAIGGFNLAVSTYSRHKPEAFEAAKCLRSAESQKYSAINSGVPPTIEAVYADPDMTQKYPMKDAILQELTDPAVRPITPAYQNASTVISTVLSPPSGIDPQRTADRLRKELQDALDSKGVLP